jgi:hypothetical protein
MEAAVRCGVRSNQHTYSVFVHWQAKHLELYPSRLTILWLNLQSCDSFRLEMQTRESDAAIGRLDQASAERNKWHVHSSKKSEHDTSAHDFASVRP